MDRPVLLVHGLFATSSLMRPLAWQLRRKGHEVHLARELGRLVTRDVRVHADELDRAVERVRRRTGAERVDLVGASQGGLVALWWCHVTGWERVGRLITLGTPFQGAPVARYTRWLGPVLPGVGQVAPEGGFITALGGIELKRPVTSVSVRTDPVCPPRVCALPGMERRVLAGGFRPLAHQSMMYRPEVVRTVDAVLREPTC